MELTSAEKNLLLQILPTTQVMGSFADRAKVNEQYALIDRLMAKIGAYQPQDGDASQVSDAAGVSDSVTAELIPGDATNGTSAQGIDPTQVVQ